MKLSDDFHIWEFQNSETAARLGIDEQFQPLPSEVLDNLQDLVDKVLQPLRVEFQAPLGINSGYRCERLNKAVGGADNSEHLTGNAADVICKDPAQLYKLASAMDLPFRQMIFYREKQFVHISYNRNDVKREAWVI